MKKSAAFIVLAITIFCACKKGSNSPTSFYNMTANINGSYSFKADGPSKAYITSATSGGIDYVYLYGKANDGKVIQLTLITPPGSTLPRGASIPINTGQVMGYYYPYGFDSTYTYALTGSLILTAITPSYEGTFNFTCADSTEITNGKFSIKAP